MKKLILAAIVAVVLSPSAHAALASKDCSTLGQFARKLMELRQQDIPISKIIKLIGAAGDTASQHALRSLIIVAYKQPAWATEEHQLDAIAEFGNMVEVTCYQETQ